MSELIAIDEFSRVQLRVGTITAAEPVPGADKLVKLQVRLGDDEIRQIVAGIREYYGPDQLTGMQVVVVANLKPARIRGVESQGMILAAVAGPELALVTVARPIDNGATVR